MGDNFQNVREPVTAMYGQRMSPFLEYANRDTYKYPRGVGSRLPRFTSKFSETSLPELVLLSASRTKIHFAIYL